MDSLIALGCSYYLLHLLRVVEVVVGSNQYASVLLTLFCFLLPVKYALIHFSVGSNGFFFLTAGLAAYYMRIFTIVYIKARHHSPKSPRQYSDYERHFDFFQALLSAHSSSEHSWLSLRVFGGRFVLWNRVFHPSSLLEPRSPHSLPYQGHSIALCTESFAVVWFNQ